MSKLGFRSVFAKLFASVMLALTLFAIAMVLLTQLVHDKDASIRSEVLATQILGQIDPFLNELNAAISKENRLQSRFMLAVIKKSFDIFDESLQAKMGLYDHQGHLLMQTDNSDLPAKLPPTPSFLTQMFPALSDAPQNYQAQVYSSTGYTLLYESRITPKKPFLSAALNLFTGTLLLLIIMAGVLWWIARSMTWRINQMSQQMSELGDGDFTVRVNARGSDEIASLARGFNQAAQKIEHLVNANSLLLAHASHELRTPITRIRLQVEMMDMLASSLPKDTKAKFDKRAHAINRDLSGLNDLVESILLVSRLDAGHAMQQVEHIALYDLINQERQHYPEATLIGEHTSIDGQAPMLTHLIRNLLNNAMLHGVPPVTVLLYGAQSLDEAGDIPHYLLQTLLNSSFENAFVQDIDDEPDGLIPQADAPLPSDQHRIQAPLTGDTHLDEAISAADNGKSEPSEGQKTSKTGAFEDLPAPNLYCNGERLDDQNTDPSTPTDTQDTSAVPAETATTQRPPPSRKLTFAGRNWYLILQKKTPLIDYAPATDAIKEPTDQDKKEDAPPKESLFKKHLKKVKPEPVRPAPNYAVLSVIDEGTGIPVDKREEIFSPFVRLQQKKKGSGLGLSLVSQIVAAHQGHITTDTIGGHTRFLVILPVTLDPHHTRTNDPRQSAGGRTSGTSGA